MTHLLQPDRRTLLKTLACLAGSAALCDTTYAANTSLPPRRPGELDIHHIDTGRGNSTLLIAPDSTSILIDAGASYAPPETSSTPRPDATRRAGEYIARYAQRHTRANHLDYFIATHLHADHIGDVSADTPLAPQATFRLTGPSDVDHLMPITTVIDRAYPDYGQTTPPNNAPAKNYLAWLDDRIRNHRTVQRAIVGSNTQIQTTAPTFTTRILAASGTVWTGHGTTSESHLPDLSQFPEPLNENMFCIALRFAYGSFSYFAAGDLIADTHDGLYPWMDIETPTVRVAGRTEVAAADHHGYFDACGPAFTQSLDAQAYILQAWDVGHPGPLQMQRLMGAWSGKPTHDVYAIDSLPANRLTNRRFTPFLKSQRGHIVIRVAPGGETYNIHVLDSSNENDIILSTTGPYTCRT